MDKDPKVLAGFEGSSKEGDDMGQGSFFVSPEVIIAQSVSAALGPVQTKIFNNLCEKGDLDEWNSMQADPAFIIRSEKSLTPPAKSNITIEPYKVTYNKVDPDKFDMALLANIVKGSFDITMFAPIFKSDRFMRFAGLVFDATPAGHAMLEQRLTKLFGKYPIQLLLKQYPLFLEKVDDIILELEKSNLEKKPTVAQGSVKRKKGKVKKEVSKPESKQPEPGV